MSFIDIENDQIVLSSSPLLTFNYFPKKFYRLYQSINFDDSIIINGSFLFNESNELHLNKSPSKLNNDLPYYKNIEKLYIHTKIGDFYINIDKLEIENTCNNINNIVYQSNIKKKKNIKYKDFIILSINPILINITYDIKNASNFVTISCVNSNGFGGTSYSYLYSKNENTEISSINSITPTENKKFF
jgi:hypothetical protein